MLELIDLLNTNYANFDLIVALTWLLKIDLLPQSCRFTDWTHSGSQLFWSCVQNWIVGLGKFACIVSLTDEWTFLNGILKIILDDNCQAFGFCWIKLNNFATTRHKSGSPSSSQRWVWWSRAQMIGNTCAVFVFAWQGGGLLCPGLCGDLWYADSRHVQSERAEAAEGGVHLPQGHDPP